MKIPVNSPCPCGSGKKYKKCCGNPAKQKLPSWEFFQTEKGKDLLRRSSEMQQELRSPRLTSRPQIQADAFGKKIRAVKNKVYLRPPEESFFDFQINLLLWTLGENWFDAEMAKALENRHVILRWRHERNEHLIKHRSPEADPSKLVAAPMTAILNALQVLADDVYQLQHALRTPRKIVERLRNMDQFQGARYEIAIASIFARCGFDIEFIDDKTKKRPEFVAIKGKERIAVEAKSRHREGVLHQAGTFDASTEPYTRIRALYNDALTHNPGDVPFLVFIDVNLPLTPEVPLLEKTWVQEAIEEFEKRKEAGEPDLDTAVVLTNFGWHYYREKDVPRGEVAFSFTQNPPHPLSNETFQLLDRALAEYGIVVDEEQHQKRVRERYPEFGSRR